MPRPQVQAHRRVAAIVLMTSCREIAEPGRWARTRAFCTRRVIVLSRSLTRHTAFRNIVWRTDNPG